MCDVLLVADTIEIPCHKAVLAACSPYFYAMFTGELAEARADRIVLQEVDGKALSFLIDFTYTAEVHVTEENVQVIVILYNIITCNNTCNYQIVIIADFSKLYSCLAVF